MVNTWSPNDTSFTSKTPSIPSLGRYATNDAAELQLSSRPDRSESGWWTYDSRSPVCHSAQYFSRPRKVETIELIAPIARASVESDGGWWPQLAVEFIDTIQKSL